MGSLNGRNGRWDGNGGRLGFRRFYRGVLHNFKQIGKMEMEMVAKVTGGLGRYVIIVRKRVRNRSREKSAPRRAAEASQSQGCSRPRCTEKQTICHVV